MSEAKSKKPAQKILLGFWDLLSISLGQVIGTGVVVLTGIAIGMTGHGTPWAFIFGLAIVAMPTLCIAALGSAVPSTGGNYTYVRDLLGRKTAFVYLALLLAAQIFLAAFALSFADYAQDLLPQSIGKNINLKPLAVIVIVLVYCANLLGLKTAARLQTIFVLGLIIALLCFIGFGLPHVNDYSPYIAQNKIMAQGFSGFFAAAFLLRLSLVGSEFVAEFGGEMKNPGKTIPLVMGITLAVVIALYFGVAVVATGVLPIEDVAYQNLSLVAKKIFSVQMYTVFIVGGVLIALVTSLNAIFAWCTRGLYMASKDGWLPEKLAVQNRFGTHYIFLTVFFLVGLVPILVGMTISQVSVLGNAFGAVFGIMPVLAIMNLAKRNPTAYKAAPFKLPVWAMTVFPLIALLIYTYGIYFSWDFIGVKPALSLMVYMGLATAYAFWREPVVKLKMGSGQADQTT